MTAELDSLHKRMLETFVQGLKDIYRDGLESVALYGSAASGEFSQKHSNINLMVILNDTSLINLKKCAGLVNSKKFNMLNPVFFTESYINKSIDVFPIEFLDMKENYVLLYGKDFLKELTINPKNLRFQCEQELKSKLINIKKAYLKSGEQELRGVIFKSFTSVMHILRNLVRLKGKDPVYLKEDCLNQVSREFNKELLNFKKILEAKKKDLKLNYAELDSLATGFVEDLEDLVNIVDEL